MFWVSLRLVWMRDEDGRAEWIEGVRKARVEKILNQIEGRESVSQWKIETRQKYCWGRCFRSG
jgi:hypothetical protein